MHVFFRVDRSAAIGTGHWARCQVLARAFEKQGVACSFFESLASPQDFLQAVRKKHRSQNHSKLATTHSQHLPQTDWVVLDGYHFGQDWEVQAREAGFLVLTIDDAPKRHYACDFLLDPNLSKAGAGRWLLHLAPHTKLYSGAKFLLLREEFLAYPKRRIRLEAGGDLTRVLVSMGGSDPPGVSLQVLQALMAPELLKLEVLVVGGAYNARGRELRALAAKRTKMAGHLNTVYLESTATMAAHMHEADLAIGAGGTTIWERAYMGLPSLVVSLADNQNDAVRHFHAMAAHESLGHHTDISPQSIEHRLKHHCRNPQGLVAMAKKAQALVGKPLFIQDPMAYLAPGVHLEP
jgi:UDP-2,4-diacetamido-2,4,6-trideoxy-beta-L-altropyranose hydrolase